MEYKFTTGDLKLMQSWDLQEKIQKTQTRILEWGKEYNGNIYISFSGGKDSTVLMDLARRVFPGVLAVFVDTGLEYPEIRNFVRGFDNVEWIKPEARFDEIIRREGYPIISKEVSKIINGARHSKNKKQNYLNRLNGLNPDFTYSEYKQQYKKWQFLLDAPFEISNRCCWYMKEKPFKKFERDTGLKPVSATMASDSRQREDGWLKSGCNAFDSDRPISKPMSFWTEQDVLTYIKKFNIPISDAYGDIVEEMTNYKRKKNVPTGKLRCTKCQRTGCMFCMFGVHIEKEPNRFQRMKETHPKQYDYCIRGLEDGGLGIGEALDFIGIKY